MGANKLKTFFIKYFPGTGIIYRYVIGAIHVLQSKKKSYSQHGEDTYILSTLKTTINETDPTYIDIGGNHPSRINNTYLFYRSGFRGIVVEPNKSYAPMYKFFRKRDTFLPYGCGDKNEILKFYHSKTPVLSSFESDRLNEETLGAKEKSRIELLPIFTLDSMLSNLLSKTEYITFLSIDTEGFNLKVLAGAEQILKKVYSILIEIDNEEEKIQISNHLKDFKFVKQFGCNLFFIRK